MGREIKENNRCDLCGGIRCGSVNDVGDYNCTCIGTGGPNIYGIKGWICPICGRGLSPFTMSCGCVNTEPQTKSKTNTGIL